MTSSSKEPDDMPRSAALPQIDAPSSYVARIREHLEKDEVQAARRVVAEALQEGSTEPGLANWAEVLAPAKILGFSPADGYDLREDIRWFDEHGVDYRGQWVAVLRGKLVAHAETYDELLAKLNDMAPAGHPLVHFIE
jgi:hypothetical protein